MLFGYTYEQPSKWVSSHETILYSISALDEPFVGGARGGKGIILGVGGEGLAFRYLNSRQVITWHTKRANTAIFSATSEMCMGNLRGSH